MNPNPPNLINKKPSKKTAGGAAGHLFVSLYLVILAFFIILNSISTINTSKSNRAIKSLQEAFNNQERQEESDDNFIISVENIGIKMGQANFGSNILIQEIEESAKTLLKLEREQFQIARGNQEILFKIPLEDFASQSGDL